MKKNIAIAVLVGLLSVKSGIFIPGYEICIFLSMTLTGFFMAIGIEELDNRSMRIRHQKILTGFLESSKKYPGRRDFNNGKQASGKKS